LCPLSPENVSSRNTSTNFKKTSATAHCLIKTREEKNLVHWGKPKNNQYFKYPLNRNSVREEENGSSNREGMRNTVKR